MARMEPLPRLPGLTEQESRLLHSQDLTGIFTHIHARRLWNGRVSASGAGSDPEQTRQLGPAFRALLQEFAVTSILDVPCGDFLWMADALPAGVRYLGGDLVPALVEQNRHRHARPGVEFVRLDLTVDDLPAADLLVCRDGLVHLSFPHLQAALQRIHQSRCRLLLATTFPDHAENTDILSGLWRPLNLCRPPCSFPPPLACIREGCTLEHGRYADKSLGLWRVADLTAAAVQPGA